MDSSWTPCAIARTHDDVRKALTPDGTPLVVNHFATWCEPCVEELPLLVAASRKFAGRVRFLGVSWDRFTDDAPPRDVAAAVDEVRQRYGLAFPAILAPDDPDGFFGALGLDTRTIPQTFVYDGRGGALWFHGSALDDVSAAELDAVLERALARGAA
jgi:thiol-disulfide isomerase/thioredoxin